MKTLAKLKLLLILLFFTTRLFAQEIVKKGDLIIHIKISTMNYGYDYMDIYKRNSKTEIIYAKFDSVDRISMRTDTAYLNAIKNPNYLERENMEKRNLIYNRHSIYDTTKVKIDLKTDTAYNKILLAIAQSTKEELEKNLNPNLRHLDGFGFLCTIITNEDTKNVSIDTPTQQTHPIASALLEKSYNRIWPKSKTPK